MKKTNKEKMKTLRLVEASDDVTLESGNQKKTYDDIEQRISRLIERWEDQDWKDEQNSTDEFDESVHYDWGNNTRH